VEPLDNLTPRAATAILAHNFAMEHGGHCQLEDNEAQLCWSGDPWDANEDLAIEGLAEWEEDFHRLKMSHPREGHSDLLMQVAGNSSSSTCSKLDNADVIRCGSIGSLSTATSLEGSSGSFGWSWRSAFSLASSTIPLTSPLAQDSLIDETERESECNDDWELEFMRRAEADEAEHAAGRSH